MPLLDLKQLKRVHFQAFLSSRRAVDISLCRPSDAPTRASAPLSHHSKVSPGNTSVKRALPATVMVRLLFSTNASRLRQARCLLIAGAFRPVTSSKSFCFSNGLEPSPLGPL